MHNPSDFNRRDFNRLSLTALGGMLAGATAGCAPTPPPAPAKTGPAPVTTTAPGPTVADAGAKPEVHLCRGLNTCKGLGGGESAGKNACAGQGECATVKHHSCGTENDCKGLGGCGEKAGANDCKGKGGCHVPLMEGAWDKVRARLETQMKEKGKTVGEAPPAKE